MTGTNNYTICRAATDFLCSKEVRLYRTNEVSMIYLTLKWICGSARQWRANPAMFLLKGRHTDKHLKLIMTLIALCCTRQSRAPNGRTDGRYQVHYLPHFMVDNDDKKQMSCLPGLNLWQQMNLHLGMEKKSFRSTLTP